MKRMTAGDLQALELLMQTTPGFEHFDSGADGILPECRSCRFHRPFWKYQSCVFAECPYCCNPVSTIIKQSGTSDAGKETCHGYSRSTQAFSEMDSASASDGVSTEVTTSWGLMVRLVKMSALRFSCFSSSSSSSVHSR